MSDIRYTNMPSRIDGDWNQWAYHILSELIRLGEANGRIEDNMRQMDNKYTERYDSLQEEFSKFLVQYATDITTLKLKSGLVGIVAGIVPAALTIMYLFISKSLP